MASEERVVQLLRYTFNSKIIYFKYYFFLKILYMYAMYLEHIYGCSCGQIVQAMDKELM